MSRDRPAYSVVERHIWHDEKFRALSRDGRDLFIYLLTSPHSNRLGMYVLDRLYAASDVQIEPAAVDAALAELIDAGRILYDHATRLVLIKRHLKHNPLKNPNVVTAAITDLEGLPFSKLLWEQLLESVNRYGRSFWKQLAEQLAEQLGDKTANQEPEPEQEPMPEPITAASDKSDERGSISEIEDSKARQAAYLEVFMPLLRDVGLTPDRTNGSIVKAMADRRAPPDGLADAIRGLAMLPDVERNGGELRLIYAKKKDEIAEPMYRRAQRAYYESQKRGTAPPDNGRPKEGGGILGSIFGKGDA